jgi:hypothetical protein
VLWLDQGHVRADGPAIEVLEQYMGKPLAAPERADALS